MSIKFASGHVQAVFGQCEGTADVGITFGAKPGVGAVGFIPIDPTEIGAKFINPTKDIDQFPVSLIFHDTRSVDVLIMALTNVKAAMTAPERLEATT